MSKLQLKQAREFIAKGQYEQAIAAAERVLDFDNNNYTAHVFLALALLERGELSRAEQFYNRAIELDPDQPLARQGLSKFYERTEQWDRLADSLLQLADRLSDPQKLAETLARLLDLRRKHGTPQQLVDTLLLFLQDSKYYSTLSALDSNSPTLAVHEIVNINSLPTIQKIVAILESEQRTFFDREFAKRRTRLGAPRPNVIRRDLDREICANSQLPHLYNQILNHPYTTDDLRLETDAKLLRHYQRHVAALSDPKPLLPTLQELVNGAILLKRPDELAWSLYLDWQDYESVSEIDPNVLTTFVDLFPANPLSEVIRGYFLWNNIHQDESKEDTSEAGLDMLLNCPTSSKDPLLAQKILADAYLFIEDHATANSLAQSALDALASIEATSPVSLTNTRTGIQITLLTALTHLYAPKHHPEALVLIDQVLKLRPTDEKTLMAKGFVLQARKDYAGAKHCFDLVTTVSHDDSTLLRAQEEAAWCQSLLGDHLAAITALTDVYAQLETLALSVDGIDLDQARCTYRIGQAYCGVDRAQAFPNFIRALKHDPGHAPSFTALGLHYADFLSPPDPVRASKCFQKAFELDPREGLAAERLCTGFADEREWDLVEVVARRSIEGEGGSLDSSAKGESDDTPTNVWAYKALGVVELQNANYQGAITAFQVALRAEPESGNLWLRLGEAYNKAGRYAAAVKALERAQTLDPADWLPKFFVAQAHQDIGLYAEAIAAYTALLDERPGELGVRTALAQAYLQLGLVELNSGFRSRAETSFVAAAHLALGVVEDHPGFRAAAWKLATDASYHLARLESFDDADRITSLLSLLSQKLPAQPSSDLKSVIGEQKEDESAGRRVLRVALRCAEYRIGLADGSAPDHSAWYDLGVTLQLWAIRHPASPSPTPADSPAPEEAPPQVTTATLITACLSKAVKQDPMNDRYWLALGLAYLAQSPRASQHALVRALELDGKNAVAWAALGMLYLHHADVELAAEAFARAQTLDPDCTVAWIGQALVAEEKGERAQARALFLHATTLDVIVPEADYSTSSKLFHASRVSTTSPGSTTSMLLPAYYLLARYTARRPHDAAGLHLYALVCERLGHAPLGRTLVQRAIEILERVYEDTEDPRVERQFMVANATLGRLTLACSDIARADFTHGAMSMADDIELSLPSFETVLALVADSDSDDSPEANAVLDVGEGSVGGGGGSKGIGKAARRRVTLECQSRLGIGMAQFAMGDYGSALATFQEAQRVAVEAFAVASATLENEAADEAAAQTVDMEVILDGARRLKSQTTIVLAQVLWALGDPEFREAAKDEMLKSINEDANDLAAIKSLAGMGILSDDDGLVDAAVSEIVALPPDEREHLDAAQNVDRLLVQYHLSRNELPQALKIAEKSLYNSPESAARRAALASLLLTSNEAGQALAVLRGNGTSSNVSSSGDTSAPGTSTNSDLAARQHALVLEATAHAMLGALGDAKRCAQRAIALWPGEARGWRVLAQVRALEGEE